MTAVNLDTTKSRPSLLRNRNFILLWCAYAISALGDHLSEMAILKTQNALAEGTDITTLTARMSFTFFIAFFALAPVAGILADRLPRRSLMITADVCRAAAFFFFASLIAWCQDWGSWGPFLPLLPIGLFAAIFSPARAALLPTLIRPDQLVRANGMISGLGVIATMAAVGAGGYLADNYAPSVSFRLDSFTYLGSAVCLAFLVAPRARAVSTATPPRRRAVSDLAAGFRYVRTHRPVLELIIIAMIVWFCGALVKSVIPAVVRDVYGGTYTTISVYLALLGLGFVLGAITITILGDALRSEIGITWGLLGIGIGMAVLALSVFLPFGVTTLRVIGGLGIVMGGFFGVATMASFNALLQRIVPDRFRGRVFGVKDIAAVGSLLVATGLLGAPGWTQVDRWVGWILIGVAIATFTAGAATLRVRMRRRGWPFDTVLVHGANEVFARFWWGFKRVGLNRVPLTGPVIVTANHTSAPDPCLLIAGSNPRLLSFIIAAEYKNWPVVRTCVRVLDCIPVKRDGRDTTATKEAIRRLRAGGGIGIFIEGRIGPPGKLRRPKDGVAMLALKTGAPVIPTYIDGVNYHKDVVKGILARHHVRLRFGPPVDLSEFMDAKGGRDVVRAATKKIYAAIYALAPEGTEIDARDYQFESDDIDAEQVT